MNCGQPGLVTRAFHNYSILGVKRITEQITEISFNFDVQFVRVEAPGNSNVKHDTLEKLKITIPCAIESACYRVNERVYVQMSPLWALPIHQGCKNVKQRVNSVECVAPCI